MKEKLKRYRKIAEENLIKTAESWKSGAQDKIYDAMRYYLLAPGKRIRPCLTLAFCDIFGVDFDTAMPFAMSLEMIHAYSLIHDDLPCMDDDDLRRGRPTCHKVYGEAMAVLAGDALLNRAFETMLAAGANNAENSMKAAAAVAKLAGPCGMIGGQVIDIEGLSDIDSLLKMYELKTSCLLMCAAEIAVELAGNLSAEFKDNAVNYARYLGLAFQIEDDILDIYGDTEVIGKSVGSDEKDGKNTVATLLGREKAENLAEKYTKLALSCAKTFNTAENPEGGEFLVWFAEMMLRRNK